MIEVLKSSLFLTMLTTGIFLLFGYIYSLIEKKNTKYVLCTFGKNGILFTGLIGTTVHELGHLIMCFIFNHKVTDFQLFNIKGYKYDEVLGYVSHRYNDKNLYQKAGNFFIGIGPIVFGTIFIIFSFRLLLPNLYSQIDIQTYVAYLYNFSIENIILLFLNLCKSLLVILFNFNNLSNINFYIFIYLMFCVSSHISLSKKDFKNSSVGVISLFLIYFIICFLCKLLGFNLNEVLISFTSYTLHLLLFLSVGLVFSIIALTISYIFYILKK